MLPGAELGVAPAGRGHGRSALGPPPGMDGGSFRTPPRIRYGLTGGFDPSSSGELRLAASPIWWGERWRIGEASRSSFGWWWWWTSGSLGGRLGARGRRQSGGGQPGPGARAGVRVTRGPRRQGRVGAGLGAGGVRGAGPARLACLTNSSLRDDACGVFDLPTGDGRRYPLRRGRCPRSAAR